MTAMEGKTAIVTGGGAGIGRAIAFSLAAAGCDVGVIGLTIESLQKVAADIATAGRRGFAAVADVVDPDAVRLAMDELASELGGLHVLVNCAGIHEAWNFGKPQRGRLAADV